MPASIHREFDSPFLIAQNLGQRVEGCDAYSEENASRVLCGLRHA
jgi:hypothetical protein